MEVRFFVTLRMDEILRCAQNDKVVAQDDKVVAQDDKVEILSCAQDDSLF